MIIIDGRKIAQELLKELSKKVVVLPHPPIFCDVMVGEDPVSMQYVKLKGKKAEEAGFEFREVILPSNSRTDEVIAELRRIQETPHLSGLIVQLPLPQSIERSKVTDAIDSSVDVDCLSVKNSELFYSNKDSFVFPAARAVVRILDSLNIPLQDKNIVIIGEGELVGKPVAHLLNNRSLQVATLHRNSVGKEESIKNADIIITATGVPKSLTGSMIKEGSIVIDAGTSDSNGGIVGDVDFDSVAEHAGFISRVPGGVGPVTVAMLLENVYLAALKK